MRNSEREATAASQFKARVIWMGDAPLYAGRRYTFTGPVYATVQVTRIKHKIDPETNSHLATRSILNGEAGEVDLEISEAIPFDPIREHPEKAAFTLVDPLTGTTVCRGTLLYELRRSSNVQWQTEKIGRTERAALKGHKPAVIWLTGLSASGKSTIANALESRLHGLRCHSILLDGDNIRHGLNRDLGFTEADRVENIRRIGEVAKLMTDAGLLVITAFISPFQSDRETARRLVPPGEFIEVYVDTPIEECERRDPKGLYARARSGQIPNFTGINSPYEPPANAEVVLATLHSSPADCVDILVRFLIDRGILNEM
jgi:bifunctional enzyme CysN/CysC